MSAEELNARDMAIEEQLNFISKQSAPKELANKPLKIKSEVTKDMVDDFRAEQEGSIFHPPSVLPVLETFHPIEVADKGRIEARKEELLKIIKLIEGRIQGRIDAIPIIKDQYNNVMAELDAKISPARKSGSSALQLLKEIEDEKRDATERFERVMAQLDSEIAQLEREKQVNISKINALDKIKGNTDALIQQNEGEKARVERVNREAVKTFESEINALNKGININQQVGESDEDYLQRIENMKGARYSQEVVVQAETFNIKRFKTKMKEIMTIPEHKLEKIIKYLEKDNMLYEANKKFPLLKTAIEKTYGISPRFTKTNDEDDLYMFIYNTLTKQFQEKEETQGLTVESKNADLLAPSKTGFISKLKLLAIYESMTGKKSFTGNSKQLAEEIIKLREKDEGVKPAYAESVKSFVSRKTDRSIPAFGFTGRKPTGSFIVQDPEQDLGGFPKRGRPPITEELKAMRAEEAGTRAFLKAEAKAVGRPKKEALKSVLKRVEGLSSPPLSPREIPQVKGQTGIKPFLKGKGVEREFYPKLVPFGAITISPAQLFYYKLLRVRDPSKHSIRGMPDVRVSDDMVHILMKIINGGTPSMTELRALSEDEKTIYDAIIMKAKLHKEMPNTYEQSIASSINKLKKRLELCEGEWNAGNDNTLIKKELNSIIRQLTELKAISEVDGRKYLKQF